jgi:hypothetical protein
MRLNSSALQSRFCYDLEIMDEPTSRQVTPLAISKLNRMPATSQNKNGLIRVFGSPGIKWVGTAMPVLSGILLAFYRDDIRNAWPLIRWPGNDSVFVPAAAFYWGFLVAGFVLFVLQDIAKSKDERIKAAANQELTNSIKQTAGRVATLPPGGFVQELGCLICECEDSVTGKAPRSTQVDVTADLRRLLRSIAKLAGSYDGRDKVRYAANVMFFVDAVHLSHFEDLLLFGKPDMKAGNLQGAMILVKDYSSAARGDSLGEDPELSNVALPIVKPPNSGAKRRYILRGAPAVFLEDTKTAPVKRMKTDVVNDVRKFDFKALGLDEDEVNAVKTAYNTEGKTGQQVMSFMSFPLFRRTGEKLGALNIHCSMIQWMGGEEERQDKCAMLLMPLVNEVGNLMELILKEQRKP